MNSLRRSSAFDRTGIMLWLGVFAVILVLAAISPETRSVVPQYRLGSAEFLDRQPLYNLKSAMGYLYAPAFAALYVPLLKLGAVFGDIVWRTLGFAVLTFAAVYQAKLALPTRAIALASLGLVLALPISLGSLRNGQSTVLLTGACWLLTIAALEGRQRAVFLWATLAILAKPTAIIMLLLCAALRPRVIPQLMLSIVAVIAVPYLFAPFDYVNASHLSFIALLTSMSVHEAGSFIAADFTAPFAALGIPVPETAAMAIRVLFAPVTLLLVIWYDRNLEPRIAALTIFLTGAFYMSLMNPRVEGGTYILMAVPCGVAIALLWETGRTRLASGLGALLFVSGLTGIEKHIHAVFGLWSKPVVFTLIATVLLVQLSSLRRKPAIMDASAYG